MATTIRDILEEARQSWAAAPFDAPRREATLLLGAVLGLPEARILARDDQPLAEAQEARFRALSARRLRGEPVAYLLGEKEFYGRSFRVDSRALIPRPETEHLIEAALAFPLPPAPRILDVGTGSGCIAVTLAAEIPGARLVACDLSAGALALARANGLRHGVGGRVRLLLSDLLDSLRVGVFDLVVSNPPYVDPADAPGLSVEVRSFEPPMALYAAEQGLALIRRLLDTVQELPLRAALMLEIGYGQLPALEGEIRQRRLRLERVVEDYAGIPRTLIVRPRS
jgi:release factor glutamine methyltransferase